MMPEEEKDWEEHAVVVHEARVAKRNVTRKTQ
jgi:hypothetical protein